MKDKANQLAEQNKAMESLRAQLQEQVDSLLQELVQAQQQSQEQEKQGQALRAELDQLRQQLQEAEGYITGVHSSIGWRLLERLRRLYLRLFPPATRRGHWFGLFIAALRVWFNEGFRALVRKSITRIRVVHRLRRQKKRLSTEQVAIAPEGRALQVPEVTSLAPLKRHSASVDIIICVHNALEYVKQCLESVVHYTPPPYSLILIDDGSDSETQTYLREFIWSQGEMLVRNEQAKGYTLAANQALRESQAEYAVLLNSDTIVTADWLDRMIACAESDSQIGLVGPLSNTASWQSIPEIFNLHGNDWAENELPEDITSADMGRLIAKYSARLYPRIRFLNGFCLLIKRKVIEEVGYFDEEGFGKGFGEENDYCLRAYKAGWQLAIADDAYVYHWGSRSYSNERRLQLRDQVDQALATKHGQPIINGGLTECRFGRVLEGIRARSHVILERQRVIREGKERWEGRRVLFALPILDPGGGGNVVFQEARTMQEMGVDVRILNLLNYQKTFEQSYPGSPIQFVYAGDVSQIPDVAAHYDAVIATMYDSVYWLESLSFRASPILGHYVQDFEPYFFHQDPERFKAAWGSYTLYPDLIRFTKTEWNRSIVKEKTGVDCHVVGPSVDIDLYQPRRRRDSDWPKRPLRIAAMVRPVTPRRNPKLTMEILKEIYLAHRNTVEIILFGCHLDDPAFLELPHNFLWRNAGILIRSQVASLLNEIDIFVDFSSYQAMGLTAMEAMACGAAIIVPNNGGARSFARHEENSLIVDTSSYDACIAALQRLIVDHDLRSRLQRQATFDVCHFFPEKAAYRILAALFDKDT